MGPKQNTGAAVPQNKPAASENIMAQGISAKKNSKGMIFGMVLLVILAIGGIGFGVWAWMDGNVQKDSLNSKIADLEAQNAELVGQISDGEEDIIDENGSNVDTSDYIYIGEWGLKIKIPDSLSTVSYRFSNEAGFTKVTIWGVDCSGGRCQYFPDFADVNKNTSGMGSITRYPNETEFDDGSAPELIFSDESYDYYLYSPQVAYTVENPSDESKWEMDGINIIRDMLSDSENYLKF